MLLTTLNCRDNVTHIASNAVWHQVDTEEILSPKKTALQFLGRVFEPRHEIFNNVVCGTNKGSDQPVHTRSLIRAFASRSYIFYEY